jgi:hypothetical protein
MGNEQLIAVVSPTPDENAWYSAHLKVLDLKSGKQSTLYAGRSSLAGQLHLHPDVQLQ